MVLLPLVVSLLSRSLLMRFYRTGQFDENGKIYNPSVGKVIANTLGEVAKQSAVGAIMQGGTIANMVGKGRGLATNILADIGGKVVDSGYYDRSAVVGAYGAGSELQAYR